MVYVIVLSVIACVLGLYYFFFKNIFEEHGIPYIRPLPLMGNLGPLLMHRQSLAKLVKNLYDMHPEAKYTGIFDVMNKPIVLLRDPELIKSIMVKHFEIFPDRISLLQEDHDPIFFNNLFFLRGNRWRKVRLILTSAFSLNKMKDMFKLMSDYAIDFSKFVAELPPQQRVMDMKDIFAKYTNDVIVTCVFGVSVDSIRDPKNLFYIYGKKTITIGTSFMKFYILRDFPWLPKILKMKFVHDEVAKFFLDLVETTIKTRDEQGIVRPDMLQLIMENRGKKENGEDLSIENIIGQVFLFFFANFNLMSSLLSFAAHEIAVNEDIQKRLHNEIDQVLEDTNGQSSYDIISHMEYLGAVVNETLRMYPTATMVDRVCVKDFELPPTLPGVKPFTVKKGQGIWIPVYGLHFDPKYFKEPEKFNPERFLDGQKRHFINTGAYLPFGFGPRKCIGSRLAVTETKVLLFHLLARCDLLPCEKTSMPMKFVNHGFFIEPKDGVWLKAVPRKNPHRTVAVNNANATRDL